MNIEHVALSSFFFLRRGCHFLFLFFYSNLSICGDEIARPVSHVCRGREAHMRWLSYTHGLEPTAHSRPHGDGSGDTGIMELEQAAARDLGRRHLYCEFRLRARQCDKERREGGRPQDSLYLWSRGVCQLPFCVIRYSSQKAISIRC